MIIDGVPSGDGECWCFLVDKETYESVTGRRPTEDDLGGFAKKGSPYRYKLYPIDLLSDGIDLKGKVITLSIEALVKDNVRK